MPIGQMMGYDPYKILDVGRDATDEEINKAFKERAKETHPDKSGSSEEFIKVKQASLVLLDPDRRARYDETGEVDEPVLDRKTSIAFGLISELLGTILMHETNPFSHDLVKVITRGIEKRAEKIIFDLTSVKKALVRAEKMRSHFVISSEHEDVVGKQLSWHIRQLKDRKDVLNEKLEACDLALEIIKRYNFVHEQHEPPMFFTTSFAGTSSTSYR